jgi:hypothetical protein
MFLHYFSSFTHLLFTQFYLNMNSIVFYQPNSLKPSPSGRYYFPKPVFYRPKSYMAPTCNLGLSRSVRDEAVAQNDYDEFMDIDDLSMAHDHIAKCPVCTEIAKDITPEGPKTMLLIARLLREQRLSRERLSQKAGLVRVLDGPTHSRNAEKVTQDMKPEPKPGSSQGMWTQ